MTTAFTRCCRDPYRDRVGLPTLLEMIRGQAKALDLDFETLLRYDLISYLRDDLLVRRHLGSEGCTTWAASGRCTQDHKPI